MNLNDDKICIRPTFSRAYYIDERNALSNTTLIAVGASNQGAGQYALGYYSTTDKDILFTEPSLPQ